MGRGIVPSGANSIGTSTELAPGHGGHPENALSALTN